MNRDREKKEQQPTTDYILKFMEEMKAEGVTLPNATVENIE